MRIFLFFKGWSKQDHLWFLKLDKEYLRFERTGEKERREKGKSEREKEKQKKGRRVCVRVHDHVMGCVAVAGSTA